ncbi:MAG: acyltransferase [Actinobacteria bacterium]|nr:acyltransferase [Actinomycetota bacterium]MBU4401998.1 acyltransferase [Actinomycetota bacterium]MBU4441344.1 acyltransferase [Actinomycetota bacterium]
MAMQEDGGELKQGPAPRPEGGDGGGNRGNWLVRNVRFIIKNRMYTPRYVRQAYRFLRFKLLHPGIRTEGMVFFPRKYEISKGKDAEFAIGAWVWIGKGCAFRAHEGSLRIGSKTTFGGNNIINCYNHVEIGEKCLFADSIYIVDFDHWYIDPQKSIRSQGIWKGQVTLGPGVWVGEKAAILCGVTVEEGAAIGAMTLVSRDVPPYAIVVGVPGRVLKYRRSPADVAWDEGVL